MFYLKWLSETSKHARTRDQGYTQMQIFASENSRKGEGEKQKICKI